MGDKELKKLGVLKDPSWAGLDPNDDPRFRPVEEFMPEDERQEWLEYVAYLERDQAEARRKK